MSSVVYATIKIKMSKAGLHVISKELEKDVFCVKGDLEPLVDLINEVEELYNPDARFVLTEKGKKLAKELSEELKEGLINQE